MERLKDCNLEHCTPEQVGVKSSAITAFINEINENNLGLQSFTVAHKAFLSHIIKIFLTYFIL